MSTRKVTRRPKAFDPLNPNAPPADLASILSELRTVHSLAHILAGGMQDSANHSQYFDMSDVELVLKEHICGPLTEQLAELEKHVLAGGGES
jgi:hypothetical protein